MKINEFIGVLAALREEYGDIEVMLPQVGDDEEDPIMWNARISLVEAEKDENGKFFVSVC